VYTDEMYYFYILECEDGSLYSGITTDVERRLKEHKEGKGAHYTRSHKPKKIVYTEKYKDRSAASKRESEVKSWEREKKLSLFLR